ncbi:hypothetical protein [Maribacter halichondriae]|uniref:hypothetical protein n=1 Tax=Maribacter halichondriae TaxID=2980554 RepID=UPI0023598AF9|nr:hypothetical protein [Maribacter sp. Hal144]
MRILLSSLCLFLWAGCASYPKKQGFVPLETVPKTVLNPYFSDTDKDYVYKTKIDAFDKSFGGILIVKKIASEHHRIVFTTELGNTIFDFEFKGESLKIKRILPEMDKKLLINVLKRDFLVLIRKNSKSLDSYFNEEKTMVESVLLSKKHYYTFEDGTLQKIVRTGNGKEKVTFLFSGINDNIAEAIEILHNNVKLKINLKAL